MLIAAAALAVPAAHAQTETEEEADRFEFVLETNKGSYKEGETIVVSGSVEVRIPGQQISLLILGDGERRVDVAQVEPSLDRRFVETFVAQGPQWNSPGTYVIRASYGGLYSAEAEFEFVTGDTPADVEGEFEVDAGNLGSFDVAYSIRGGTLEDLRLVPENLGLEAEIDAPGSGSLTLAVPREFVGAEDADSRDIPFIVIIDAVEVEHAEEVVHSDYRSITVDFARGDSTIQVIGTYAIPEFGAALAVMAAGAAAAAVASRRL